ncbi:MAG: hypothetical protein ACI9VM_000619 [Candidatus Azotimanducaceae bacterium]|jgi:hypothetical protein
MDTEFKLVRIHDRTCIQVREYENVPPSTYEKRGRGQFGRVGGCKISDTSFRKLHWEWDRLNQPRVAPNHAEIKRRPKQGDLFH